MIVVMAKMTMMFTMMTAVMKGIIGNGQWLVEGKSEP